MDEELSFRVVRVGAAETTAPVKARAEMSWPIIMKVYEVQVKGTSELLTVAGKKQKLDGIPSPSYIMNSSAKFDV